MRVTTKELRIQPGKIIEQALQGQEIIITYRGKATVKMVPVTKVESPENSGDSAENLLFGLWQDHKDTEDVETYLRTLREGRKF